MTEDRTITESEFERFEAAYRSEWTAQIEPSLRAAFESIGFNIVPDPIPEPTNGEIVRTESSRGSLRLWTRDTATGLWNRTPEHIAEEWSELSSGIYGPLRIFAEVKP